MLALRSLHDRQWLQSRITERSQPGQSKVLLILSHALRQIASGVVSNRLEQGLYHTHPELPLAPVLRMYLGGLILVMERGEDVPAEHSANFRAQFSDDTDLVYPYHVCRFGTELRFIDYGNSDAQAALLATYWKRPTL